MKGRRRGRRRKRRRRKGSKGERREGYEVMKRNEGCTETQREVNQKESR